MTDIEKLRDAVDYIKRNGFKFNDKFSTITFDEIEHFAYYDITDKIHIICVLKNNITVHLAIKRYGEVMMATSATSWNWVKVFDAKGYTFTGFVPPNFNFFPHEALNDTGSLTKGAK